jgi:aspartate oxidase
MRAVLSDSVVERVVKRPAQIKELISWSDSTRIGGKIRSAPEGGHSEFRILHHKAVRSEIKS